MAHSAPADDSLTDRLLDALQRSLRECAPQRILVAWSGGADSTALLHACQRVAGQTPVLAMHVNHGLQDCADEMAAWCVDQARQLDVACEVLTVCDSPNAGDSVEAWARGARYSALAAAMRRGDVLLTAHHAQDQAESVLLAMLRGSGLPGLSGIATQDALGDGVLLRPWKAQAKQAIDAYVARYSLAVFSDPSNADQRFARNWLRHALMPELHARYAAVDDAFGRSAAHVAEAQAILHEVAEADMRCLAADADSIAVSGLSTLTPARQRNVLRHWLRQRGVPVPSRAVMQQLFETIVSAAADAQPLLQWAGVEVRRHRDRLYVSRQLPDTTATWSSRWRGASCQLPEGFGLLHSEGVGEWRVRFAQAGDVVRQAGRPSKTWTRWCQEAGVPTWLRFRTPLIFSGETLCAAGGQVLDAQHAPQGLRWRCDLPGAERLVA